MATYGTDRSDRWAGIVHTVATVLAVGYLREKADLNVEKRTVHLAPFPDCFLERTLAVRHAPVQLPKSVFGS